MKNLKPGFRCVSHIRQTSMRYSYKICINSSILFKMPLAFQRTTESELPVHVKLFCIMWNQHLNNLIHKRDYRHNYTFNERLKLGRQTNRQRIRFYGWHFRIRKRRLPEGPRRQSFVVPQVYLRNNQFLTSKEGNSLLLKLGVGVLARETGRFPV